MLNAWLYYAKNLDGGCMGKTLQILLHFLTMSLEVSKCHPSVSGCSSCCHRSRSRRAVGSSENLGNSLLTAERIWFKCDLYLRFIPPINLWKVCIDLRPFSKYFNEPFSRMLRSPRSNNLEIQNDENSK